MKCKKMAVILSAVMLLTSVSCSFQVLAAGVDETTDVSQKNHTDMSTYAQYIQGFTDCEKPQECVTLDLHRADGNGIRWLDDAQTRLYTSETESVHLPVEINKAGLYQIRMTYSTDGNGGETIERRLYLDGKVPFDEANCFSFRRVYENDPSGYQCTATGIEYGKDANGNHVTPLQVEVSATQTVFLKDSSGYIAGGLYLYFSAGSHVLTLEALRESLVLEKVELCQEQAAPFYADYIEKYKDKVPSTGTPIKIQGEAANRKSDAVLYAITDRASASTEPSDPTCIRLNTIGGSNWSSYGQWLEWDVEVPTEGLYRIALKSRQNFTSGMRSYRRLLINQEVPFAEAENLSFPYQSNWQTRFIADGQEEYWFYLNSGKNTIRLEVVLGDNGTLLQQAKNIVLMLNDIYRQIIMYTGTEPDGYRDYHLDKVMPEVLEKMEQAYSDLILLSENMLALSKERGSANTAIDSLLNLLKRFREDSRRITKSLAAFKDATVSIGSWITTQSSQPLEIDYIYLMGEDGELPKDSGFFENLWFGFRMFLNTFFEDYTIIGGMESRQAVEVWISGGRDQAQVLKSLITNYFTPESGISVNLKIVGDQLLMATMSNTGPDVALMQSGGNPMNFAVRKALENLEGYEGFDETATQFMDSAFAGYRLNGSVYALPESQSFPVMFYRRDILDELGLKTPNTWKELYTTVGVLQKKSLEFGFSFGTMGAYGLVLYQNGGQFYKDDGTATALGEEVAVEAFREWTRLYTNYGLPLEYDPANRFRTGEMPLLIANYALYSQLSVFAPEIKGLWGIALVPGTLDEESGIINRSVIGEYSGCVMLRQSKQKQLAWQFMKWWVSTEIQALYGRNIESVIGTAARYTTANVEALKKIGWRAEDYAILEKQREYVAGVPELPGSYYITRHLENAFRKVINTGADERETICEYARIIDAEIAYKRHELGLD